MPSSYYMEQKTFIEASATYWRKMFFEASTFEGLQVVSIKNKNKNKNTLVVYFGPPKHF